MDDPKTQMNCLYSEDRTKCEFSKIHVLSQWRSKQKAFHDILVFSDGAVESVPQNQCRPNKLAFYKLFFLPQWEWTPSLHYDLNKGPGFSIVLEDQGKNSLTVTEFKKYYEDADNGSWLKTVRRKLNV